MHLAAPRDHVNARSLSLSCKLHIRSLARTRVKIKRPARVTRCCVGQDASSNAHLQSQEDVL